MCNDEFSYFNDIKILRIKHVENVSLELCTLCGNSICLSKTESHAVLENFMDWQISSLSCQQFSQNMFIRAFEYFIRFLKTTTCFICKSHQEMQSVFFWFKGRGCYQDEKIICTLYPRKDVNNTNGLEFAKISNFKCHW